MKNAISSYALIKKFAALTLALAYVLLFASLLSCEKEDRGVLPRVSTSSVGLIARTTAIAFGTMLEEGSDSIADKGFCWSLEAEPDLADHTTEYVFSDQESIEGKITGLQPNTTYYLRAFATNRAGTAYGNEVIFTTKPADPMTDFNPDLRYGAVRDIDGNTYRTIVIGEQEWMAENLKTTRYSDGEAIPYLATFPESDPPMSPGYTWYENNEPVFRDMYGAYYNWSAINTGKVCPSGWHVPSDEEWKILERQLGMRPEEADANGFRGSTEGAKIKEAGTYNWVMESEPGSNLSGFTALPGGHTNSREGIIGLWWTATPLDPGPDAYCIWYRMVFWENSWIARSEIDRHSLLNVRCVKD